MSSRFGQVFSGLEFRQNRFGATLGAPVKGCFNDAVALAGCRLQGVVYDSAFCWVVLDFLWFIYGLAGAS